MHTDSRSKTLNLAVILCLAMAIGIQSPREALCGEPAMPDTSNMTALQKMAWRARLSSHEQSEEPVLPPLPANVRRLTETKGKELQPCWAPDGKSIYYMYDDGGLSRIMRLDLASGESVALTDSLWRSQMPDISPDGRFLVYNMKVVGLGGKLWVTRIEDGQTAKLTTSEENSREIWPRWSRNGRKIYFILSEYNPLRNTPCEIARDGENLKKLMSVEGSISHPSVSRSGKQVAWAYRQGQDMMIRLINTSISAIYEEINLPEYQIAGVDWFPGDTKLVVSYLVEAEHEDGFHLGILDLATEELVHLIDLGGNEMAPRVSPDGNSIVFHCKRGSSQTDLFLMELR